MKLTELRIAQRPDEQEQSYVIYSDLDGVLVDFKKEMQKVFRETKDHLGGSGEYNDEHYAASADYRAYMWKAIHKYQELHGEVVWRDCDMMPDAQELWDYIKPHNAQILTATGNPKLHADRQKREWVSKHLGSGVRVNFVISAADKIKFVAKNHILIDDQLRAIDPWVANGGIGIHHTSAAHTIQELKKLGVH